MTGPTAAPPSTASARTAWLTTLRGDGSPHTTPVWFVLTGDTLWIATSVSAVKARNVARDPRVSLAFDGTGDRPAVAEGRAEALPRPREHVEVLAAFAAKYDGWDAADEDPYGPRTLLRVTLTRWLMVP